MKQVIVNERDEIIGYKSLSEIGSDDIYRVSALWIENSKGDILLALRGFMKHNNPWKWWAAVAGTIDEGETYEQNIYKEAQEEIGLTWEVFEEHECVRVTGKWNYFCQWYTLVLDRDVSKFVKEEGQVEMIRWFHREELQNLIDISPEIFTENFVEYIKKRLN